MPISENAKAVLERRYLARNEAGEPIETVDGLFHRVADAVAAADAVFDPKADVAATARAFYGMMTELDFLPNSPTLMNAGRPLGQLSACFVLPVADSMEDIFDAIKNAAAAAASGDQDQARVLLSTLLSSPEGAQLAAKIIEVVGR